jgi:hypothetical protein
VELTALIPLSSIEVRLGKPLRQDAQSPGSSRELAKVDPDDLMGIALFSWHRVVGSGKYDVEPTSIGPLIDEDDPVALADFVEHTIGRPLFVEAGLMDAFAAHRKMEFKTATSCAAVLFTGELHLYDIAMADPRHVIPKAQRQSPSQEYRGFGLLSEVIENVNFAASERGCEMVSLTAAWLPLVPIFERHGFEVEDSILAKRAMKFGSGIPMLRRVL